MCIFTYTFISIYIHTYIFILTSSSKLLFFTKKLHSTSAFWWGGEATKVKSYSERYRQVISTHTHPNFLAPLTSVITEKKELCLPLALKWLVTVTYISTTHQICSLIQMLNH